MSAEPVACVSCGALNPSNLERCNDCGAVLDKLTPLTVQRRADGEDVPAFSPKWLGATAGGVLLVAGFFVVLLPFVLTMYDPQGFPGVAIVILASLLVGLGCGLRVPYRVYLECAAGATIAACVLVSYVASVSDVRALDTGRYVVAVLLSGLSGGLGAFLGEHAAARTRAPVR